MAEPARRLTSPPLPAPGGAPSTDDPPVVDAFALERAYRLQRARRTRRIQRDRATQYARLRYWYVVTALLIGSAVIGVTIYDQIRKLFGL